MLLEQTNKDFRTSFLLKLTKSIIENTETYQKIRLEAEVKGFIKKEREEKEKIQEKTKLAKEIHKQKIRNVVREKMAEDKNKLSDMYIKGLPLELEELSSSVQQPGPIFRRPPLKIPEIPLPATLSYLRPTPTSEWIDVGSLNVLVRDPLVKIIECNGPNENIFVGGIMGYKKTPIKLSKEEILDILERFSFATNIPISEGLFKAAAGNLVISAVISDVAGIKFVIRKISKEF